MKNTDTICLCLGTYRNLTTLTAAMLSLHPNCLVLNHNFHKVFAKSNILTAHTEKDIDKFIERATSVAARHGSIIGSHAFKYPNVREIYQTIEKKKIDCIFWKESYKLTNYILTRKIDILKLPANIKFVMPVRNPMDCAASIHRLPAQKSNHGVRGYKKKQILKFVLNNIAWFDGLYQKNTNKFFRYYEHSLTEDKLNALEKFLNIKHNNQWIDHCKTIYVLNKNYTHSPRFKRLYVRLVQKMFTGNLRKNLLRFV